MRYSSRVSTGIPGYGSSTEIIQKKFHLHFGKGSGNPDNILKNFFLKLEISGALFRNYGRFWNIAPENSSLRNDCSGKFRENVT